MKKFLSKKPVMISFIVTAIIMLLFTIVWCVRPVSLGYTYTYKENNTAVKYHFNSSSKLTIKMSNGEEEQETKMWYFQKDGLLVISGMLVEDFEINGIVIEEATSKKDFKDWKKSILENWDKDVAKEMYPTINAFKVGESGEYATCVGAIVSVVILGLLTVATTTFAVLSTIIVLKKKYD